MKIMQYQHDRCIYCCKPFTKENPRSQEHIIPQFLGGFSWEDFSHHICNSKLGYATDSEWQKNHEVIKALTELEMPVDPNVFKQAQSNKSKSNGKPLYELIGYGKTKMPFSVNRNNRTVNIPRDSNRDSIKGISAIAGIIRKDFDFASDRATAIARRAVETFTELNVGQVAHMETDFPNGKITISTTPVMVEGTLNMLDHFKSTISARPVAKIAYAFAAALLRGHIFSEQYEGIRKFLMVPNSSEKIRILPLDTRWDQLKPLHVLGSRVRNGKLYCVIILFHCFGFIVETGPAEVMPDILCSFDIKQRKIDICHFSPEDEEKLNAILLSASRENNQNETTLAS